MVLKKYEIPVWGTVLFLDVGSSAIDEEEIDFAVNSVKTLVEQIDLDF